MAGNPATAGVDLGFKVYNFVNADAIDQEQYIRAKARRDAEIEDAFDETLGQVEEYIRTWTAVFNNTHSNPAAARSVLRHLMLRLANRGCYWSLKYLSAFHPYHRVAYLPETSDSAYNKRQRTRQEAF